MKILAKIQRTGLSAPWWEQIYARNKPEKNLLTGKLNLQVKYGRREGEDVRCVGLLTPSVPVLASVYNQLLAGQGRLHRPNQKRQWKQGMKVLTVPARPRKCQLFGAKFGAADWLNCLSYLVTGQVYSLTSISGSQPDRGKGACSLMPPFTCKLSEYFQQHFDIERAELS